MSMIQKVAFTMYPAVDLDRKRASITAKLQPLAPNWTRYTCGG